MPKSVMLLPLIVTSLGAFAWRANAEDWPAWRGPRGDGTSIEAQVPRSWNGTTGENVAWKSPVPGQGHGSPIVSSGRIFLSSCLVDSHERVVVCFDRSNGRQLWQQTVIKSPLEAKHQLNSFASGTPASDGETVYVAFLETGDRKVPAQNVSTPRDIPLGSLVVAAYDFDGNRRWLVRPGEFSSPHGFCSSPVLYRNMVIVNADHDGDSYIVALDRQTGQTLWKRPRAHGIRSYVTPLIREIAGTPQMVLSGSNHVASFDPRDGAPRWTVEGPAEQYVASMVFDGSLFFMVGGFPTYHVVAIKPEGTGDVTNTHVAWHVTNVGCYVPSPVVIGKHLLVADDRGTANCFETTGGKRLWQTRLGMHYSASLIAAEGRAYFLADDGVMKIVEPGETLNVVAENPLGEYCYASPAVSDGQLFIRGEKHLFAIGSGRVGSSGGQSSRE